MKGIVDENKTLADPTKTLTLADIATSSKNAATFFNDLKAAVKAGQAVSTTPVVTKKKV